MRLRLFTPCLLLFLGLSPGTSHGQSLQSALDDVDVGDRWKYNDWDAARDAAEASGKPILALFR